MDIIALETPENTQKYKAPPVKDTEPFFLCECGKTGEGTPCYQIRLSSGVATLQYILAGEGVLICNERVYAVKAGDAFLLPEGADQIYYSLPGKDFSRLWINFKGALSGALLSVYGIADRVVFPDADIKDALLLCIDACQRKTDPEECRDACAQGFFCAMQTLAKHGGTQDMQSPIGKTRHYIDTHIKENIRLSDVAHAVGFSPEYLIRLFKKNYGITPHSYILQSKLRIAMVMLTSQKGSIEQIAQALSFSDARHFSSQFLKYVGMRPSEYRRSYTKERE